VVADVAQCTREMRAARGPLQRELGFNEEASCTLAAERSDQAFCTVCLAGFGAVSFLPKRR